MIPTHPLSCTHGLQSLLLLLFFNHWRALSHGTNVQLFVGYLTRLYNVAAVRERRRVVLSTRGSTAQTFHSS